MELIEDASVSHNDNKSATGLDNLSAINAPESVIKSKKDKDKKKKKKRDKSQKELKVKDFNDPQEYNDSQDDDVDNAIMQHKKRLGNDDDANSAYGISQKGKKLAMDGPDRTNLHKTAQGFNPSGRLESNMVAKNNLLDSTANDTNARGVGADGFVGRRANQTIDDGGDNLSNQDAVSAGGSRYVVGFKGGLKFYGQQADDSISQNSGNASINRTKTADRQSKPMRDSKSNKALDKPGNRHHSTLQADQIEREMQGDD